MEPFPTLNAKDSADAPPERLLLSWLDQYFAMFAPPGPGWIWRLSASALRRYLLAPEHPWSEQAARVLSSPDAVGMHLGKLANLFPHRFQRVRACGENGGRSVCRGQAHAPEQKTFANTSTAAHSLSCLDR